MNYRFLVPVLVAALFAAAPTPARAAESRAIVYATDFGSGSINTVAFGPPRTPACDLANVCSDAVLRFAPPFLFVVERFGCDNIRELDPITFAPIGQFSVGNGSNPNDIYAISESKAYVTRYDSPDLWVVNPLSRTFVKAISLTAFADADGIPEMNRITYHADRIFVSCQRLDRNNFFTPTDSSLVVVIDVQTDQFVDCDPVAPGVQGILLPRTNPTTEFATAPDGVFLLGCTGAYGVNDGGVVAVDPRTLTANTVEVTEAQLGGDVNDVAVGPGASGFAKVFCVISDASFNTNLVSYTRVALPVVASVYPATGFVLADAEVNDRDEVWLCDRTVSAPGMRVFSATTGAQLSTGAISTCLPPSDIVFDVIEPVAVSPGPAPAGPAGVSLAGIAPNPAAGRTAQAIQLRASAAGSLEVRIVNAAGRAIRTWRLEAGPGETVLTWDGADDAGRAAPAGVYLVHANQAGRPGAASARLVRLAPARL